MENEKTQAQGSGLSDQLDPVHYKNGYLHNCFLMPHKDQDGPMFEVTEEPEHYLTAHLDGYAIIPMAEYERLKALEA